MPTEVSIADAKAQLTKLVHRVEHGRAVTLTRRGRPVAVLISREEYERMHRQRLSFADVIDETLEAFKGDGVTPAEFPGKPDATTGPKSPW